MASATDTRDKRKAAPPVTSEILDRLPPQNLQAERGVLGSILLVPTVCDEVSMIIRQDDFYSDAHRIIYEHMMALHEQGKRIDPLLLIDRLKNAGQYEAVGGNSYMAEIAQAVPSAANAEFYAKIVQEKATSRSLILAATEVLRDAYDESRDPRLVLSESEERIFAIHDKRWSGQVVKMDVALKEAFARIDAKLEGESDSLHTGLTDLDKLTSGMHPAELIILAARPAMGKTALAANIADHVSVVEQGCTLFVSLEMSRLELAQRMLCSRGEIGGEKFRSGFMATDEKERLMAASAELASAQLFIDDSPSRTITEIAATARRLKRKHGLGLIIIDYLQLIEPDNSKDPRQEQVAKIARRLKGMARELSVPVLCLAQLNRGPETSKKDNIPRLNHLRESGAIEQDADVVMFVHREEYYLTPAEAKILPTKNSKAWLRSSSPSSVAAPLVLPNSTGSSSSPSSKTGPKNSTTSSSRTNLCKLAINTLGRLSKAVGTGVRGSLRTDAACRTNR